MALAGHGQGCGPGGRPARAGHRIAAGLGLVLYFACAVVNVARAPWYSRISFPQLYLASVVGSLALGFAF
jgi:hypothetical protein